MARSLIQTVNQSTQTVAENSIISLGSVVRRFGCDCRLSGNGIEISGNGYYTIEMCVTAAPTAAGTVTVALFEDGVQIPGAIASGSVSTAENPVTLPIIATIRQTCCQTNNLTAVLVAGAGEVSNITVRVEKA